MARLPPKQRLVEIMQQRLECFELLLGGVGAKIETEDLTIGTPADLDSVTHLKRADDQNDPLSVV